MSFCDFDRFLGERRKRIEFMAERPRGAWPSLLHFGHERMRPGGRGVRCKDHLTCYLVHDGRAWVGTAGGPQVLEAGSGLFCPAFAEKDLRADPEISCSWSWIGCSGSELGRACHAHGLREQLIFDDAALGGLVTTQLRAMAEEIAHPGPLFAEQLGALLQILFGGLLRFYGSVEPHVPRRQHESIATAQRLITTHSGEIAGVAELARQVGLERSYFSRLFKAQTGMTVAAALREARLRRACELLRDRDLNIQTIAGLCGYEEYYSFYRAFLRATGHTPSAYRAGGEEASTDVDDAPP